MPDITYREAIRQGLAEALNNDERVMIMGEDIGAYGGSYAVTKGFLEEYGEKRIKDTPISESAFVGAGIGAAMGGLKPIVEIMTINFSLLALDQIVNIAAKLRYMSAGQVSVPLIIRTVTGAGSQLAATHSQNLEGWYAQVPGLKVVVPSTPYDAWGLLRTAVKDNNPIIFIEHSLLYGNKGPVPTDYWEIPFGKADVKREGRQVTIIGYLRTVHLALQAADQLAQQGIDAEVIDLRTLRPMDSETIIQSVSKTNRAVVVTEGWRLGNFGNEVIAQIQESAFDHLDAPIQRVTGADAPMPYARDLELASMPTDAAIVAAVKRIL